MCTEDSKTRLERLTIFVAGIFTVTMLPSCLLFLENYYFVVVVVDVLIAVLSIVFVKEALHILFNSQKCLSPKNKY